MSTTDTTATSTQERVSRYSLYALLLLTVANLLNYLDRKLLSILANAIQEDLGIGDAEIGFLYGTVFAALYAVVGLPMGRMADRWVRNRLMGLGVGLWSLMTALSGFAVNLSQLAAARVGVSVGESVANPTSHSLIADYFPPHRRGFAFATYLSGIFVGGGMSMIVGGVVVQGWDNFADSIGLGGLLKPWQAAFLVCGLPGLIVAVLLIKMREPLRGTFDKTTARQQTEPRAWQSFGGDVMAVIPPTSFVRFYRFSPAALKTNLYITTVIVLIAGALTALTGDIEQWVAVGFAAYAICSFAQMLKLNDPALYRLTFGSRAFQLLVVGMSITAAINHSLAFWATPHLLRNFDVSTADAGLMMGVILIVASGLGVILGGVIVDRLRRKTTAAAPLVTLVSLLGSIPFAVIAYLATSPTTFYVSFSLFALIQNAWAGGAAAVLQEIVLPRMRATASASYSLLMMTTGFALGPYTAGKVSALTGSLSIGVLSLYILVPLALIALVWAIRVLPETINSREQRAGEML